MVNKDANSKLICKLTDQLAISIFIHHSLTDNLFGSIRIPEKEKEMYSKASWYTDSGYAIRAKNIVYKAVVNKDANSKLICELTDQLAISIFIHHSLTDNLFGSICIPEKVKQMYNKTLWYTDSRYAVRAKKIVCKAVVNKDAM